MKFGSSYGHVEGKNCASVHSVSIETLRPKFTHIFNPLVRDVSNLEIFEKKFFEKILTSIQNRSYKSQIWLRKWEPHIRNDRVAEKGGEDPKVNETYREKRVRKLSRVAK